MGKPLYGTYERSLDAKGRLQLPAKLIAKEVKTLFVLRGFEGCLAVYEEDAFNRLMETLGSMDFQNEEQRAYIRLAASSVKDLPVDAHGRVLLGKALLKDRSIGQSVTLIGVIDHFEIWDPTSYARYEIAHAGSYDNPLGTFKGYRS